MILDLIGKDKFEKAIQILKKTTDELSLDEFQEKYNGKYAQLLPFLSKEMVEKYFGGLLALAIKNE